MGKEVAKTVWDDTSPLFQIKQDKNGKPLPVSSAQKEGLVIARLREAKQVYYVQTDGEFYCQQTGSLIFDKLNERDLTDLIKEYMLKLGFWFSAKEFSDTIKLMKVHLDAITEVSKRFIMVSEHIFWDKQLGQLVESPSEACFYRLFDVKAETKHIVKIPPFNSEQEQRLWNMYEQVKGELERGEEVERFDPLKVWANGSHDVYMDLHRAHAYSFLQIGPMGVYLLIGPTRNGKSSYTGMGHTIFGTNNTSTVKLADLDDWHYNHELLHTLWNAPDEEKQKSLEDQSIFKTIADHGVIKVKSMASEKPLEINCDFVCMFPANHIPKWEGTGAVACLKRSLIIPFTNDLSGKDKGNSNFAKETFTADFMCEYLGSVFAYAYYYHRHPLVFSPTLLRHQEAMEADAINYKTYMSRFCKYFSGHTGVNLVYQDYKNWCSAQELKWAKRDDFKVWLDFIFPEETRHSKVLGGKRCRVWGEDKPNYHIFHEGLTRNDIPEVESLQILHQKETSIIDQLDQYYFNRGYEK